MASHGLSRLLVFLGGGSLVYTSLEPGSVSDTLRAVAGLLVGGGRGSSDGSLNNKVDSLAQEMRQLMARGGGGGAPSTIVMQGGGGGGAVRGFVMLVLPGAAGYVYLKYMGYDIADLKWVSASRFQEAIASLGKAQEVLDTKLLAFRTSAEQALTAFRAIVERKFGEQQHQIETQVGAVHVDVQGVRSELAGVDQRVQRLEGKIDDASSQLAYSNQGINLLCSVVAESLGSQNSESVRRLQTFAATSGPSRTTGALEGNNFAALEAPPIMVEVMRTSPTNDTASRKMLWVEGGGFSIDSRNQSQG